MRNKKKEFDNTALNSAIQSKGHTNAEADGALTFEMSKNLTDVFLPFGPSARFIYNLRNGYFTFFDESVYEITGFEPNEIVFSDTISFILELVVEEHLTLTGKLTEESYEFAKNNRNNFDSLVINLEYSINHKNGEKKRVISQYNPAHYEEDGYPKINIGRMVDISHLKKDGIPQLFILGDNKLVFHKKGNPEEMIKSQNIIFSKKEVEVLKYLGEGLVIKEIADKMNCSIPTIYTHKRNIKHKSQMDINKIIVNLKERGII